MPSNCCSYCREPGHTINMCDSPNITMDYENIKIVFNEISQTYFGQEINKIHFIRTICRNYNLSRLKAIGVRYLWLPATSNKNTIAIELWNSFSSILVISRQNILNQLPTVPDEIPDFAQDLLQQPEEELGWYIDIQPQFRHFEVNTPPRMFEFGIPPPPPLIRNRFAGGRRLILPNQYNPINDEFMAFAPQNLNNVFQETMNPQVKKYNIIPTIICSKNSEEIELCEECSICYEIAKQNQTITINCGHKFCGKCIKNTLESNNINTLPTCALCRTEMKTFEMNNQDVYNLVAEHCNL
jgi:hypothetical protein